MPAPTIAPMPRAVSDQGPRLLRSRCSGSSAEASSLSMLLVRKSACAILMPPQVMNGKRDPYSQAARGLHQRDEVPGPFFLTLGLWEPRGSVLLGLGGRFFRASRFNFFRSALSVIFLVSIIVCEVNCRTDSFDNMKSEFQ